MVKFSIMEEGEYSSEDIRVAFTRSRCSNLEHTKAMLEIISSRKIYCVLVKCEGTKSLLAHETYNGSTCPPQIAFLETEEHGPYTVEVS